MQRKSRKRWIVLIAFIFILSAAYLILSRFYPEENKRIRIQLRESVEGEFPDLAKAVRSRYGIKPVIENNTESGGMDHCVVLIHGLDDPGKVWMNLKPKLIDKGFRVWIFTYPDDQPISDSARFFFKEMKTLKNNKVEDVSIVAHSMGGLVAREMLTNPELSYAKTATDGTVPAVSSLIMVGTPNYGSLLAQLRIFTEFRDQLSNLFMGDYVWIEGIMDGAGEAGIDLAPDSVFLKELNNRPHPKHLNMAVIAGVMSPMTSERIQQFARDIDEETRANTKETDSTVADFLNSMSLRLGDGIVSVDSAELDGYPIHVVEGTHLSIIRNINKSSERVPPAVPIVMEYLGGSASH